MTTIIADRQTSLGQLKITVIDGVVTLTINDKIQSGCLTPMASLVTKDGIVYSHSFGKFGIRSDEATAAFAATAAYRESPEGQRVALAAELAAVEAGAYPGSREWQRGQIIEAKINAFDAANPDVIVALRAKIHAAKDWSLAERMARGAD